MKIVVLNESFLEEHHLASLRKLGEVEIFDGTSTREEALSRSKGATVVIGDIWFVPFDKEFFDAVDGLKLLCINSTGFDTVDLEAANQSGVLVANTPNFSTESVAERTFALVLAVAHAVSLSDKRMKAKIYEIDPADPSQKDLRGFELAGKTLGIIGLGAIGRRVAEIGSAFGMKVLAYNRSSVTAPSVKTVPLNELLEASDVVSLHTALATGTKDLINAANLSLMKPGALLINTARGGVVDTEALYAALKSGKLRGAGLDIIAPSEHAQALVDLPNVVATPHTAFFTNEAIRNLADIIVANIEKFAAGQPQNIVNEAKS